MTTRYFFIYNLDGKEQANWFTGPDGMNVEQAHQFAQQKIADEHGPLAAPTEPSTIERIAGEIKGRAEITKIWSEHSREALN